MKLKTNLIAALSLLSIILVTCVENHVLPNFGNISIISDPTGVEVFLDGEKKGTTNLELNEVLSGNYSISLKKSEYKDTVFTVEVDENQSLSFDIFMKETNPKGKITVTSDPSGASIFINNSSTGQKTPATFSNMERGEYNFSLRLNLYDNSNFVIDLAKDQTVSQNSKLQVASSAGILFINSTPTGAKIYIDDTNTGKVTPDTIKPVVPGEHSVKLELANYKDSTFTTNITAGVVTSENINLKAVFMINADVNPVNSGIINGVGSYVEGELAELEAIPNEGYNFINWTENDNEVSDNVAYSFVVDGTRNLVANFALKQYQISATTNPLTAGVISGIGTYKHGDEVNLTVTLNTGFGFINWTENDNQVSTSENYTFTATGNRTLVANLSLNSYRISGNTDVGNVNISWTGGAGTVSSSNGDYSFNVSHGWSGTVTPSKVGYSFSPDNKTYSNLSSNRTDQDFTAIVNITVSVNPVNAGTISGLNTLGNYNYNETVNLTANANSGYKFLNWTEEGSEFADEANISFSATQGRDLVANFISIGNLQVTSDPVGASIFIDNVNSNQVTPFTFQDMQTGDYLITLKLDDFADTTLTADVTIGQTTNLDEVYLRDNTPIVNVEITYTVDPNNNRINFYFSFNQNVFFEKVEFKAPRDSNGVPLGDDGVWSFNQNIIEGKETSFGLPESIPGNWEFTCIGNKLDGRNKLFNFIKTKLVQ